MNISLTSFDESKKIIIGQQTLFVKSLFKRKHGGKRHHGETQVQKIYRVKRVPWNT